MSSRADQRTRVGNDRRSFPNFRFLPPDATKRPAVVPCQRPRSVRSAHSTPQLPCEAAAIGKRERRRTADPAPATAVASNPAKTRRNPTKSDRIALNPGKSINEGGAAKSSARRAIHDRLENAASRVIQTSSNQFKSKYVGANPPQPSSLPTPPPTRHMKSRFPFCP